MAGTRRWKISKRTVERFAVEDRDLIFWDRDLPGFGVRVYPSGAKVYLVQCRARGRSRRVTLGRHGTLTAIEARRAAARTIARLKGWEEPEPVRMERTTVADVAKRYLEEHVAVRCKPGSQRLYGAVVARHLLPALGDTPVAEVTREEVAALHHRLRNTPYAANRAVGLLGQILDMAELKGLRPRGIGNPCRSIEKYRERRHERFLSDEEFRRLGRVLEEAGDGGGGASPAAVTAIRLLLLTGCRRSEVLRLRWEHVDLAAGELHLPDSKTGARRVPLSPAAAAVLGELPRMPGNPWVIPGRIAGAPLKNLQYPWEILRARAGLDNVRIHDLRHSFASRALALGESLPMIGELLGHRRFGPPPGTPTSRWSPSRYRRAASPRASASRSCPAEPIPAQGVRAHR